MKPFISAHLVILCAALAACGSSKDASKTHFSNAIDQALGKRCIAISMVAYTLDSHQFPAEIPEMQEGGFISAQHARDSNAAKFVPWDALVTAGLVTRASAQVKPQFGNGSVPGRIYNLTAEGKKFLKSPDGMTLCAGHLKVKEIVRYTEPAATMGATMSEVRYTNEPVDVPAWARVPAVQEAFPELKATLTDTQEHRTVVVLNNDGWAAELSPF